MFDFDPKKKKSQDVIASAMRGGASMRAAQAHMPIADVEGPFLRLKDGATCIYMTYPGINLALLTHAQRQDYALANGQVLAALQCDSAGIWLLPERVSVESNIALADREIERLSEKVRVSRTGTAEDMASLEILERHVRPAFAKQAIAPGSIAWKTYLGMRFDHKGDADIMTTANTTAKMLADRVGKRPVILSDNAILDFIDLYFRGQCPEHRTIGPRVVMPEIR